MSKIVSVAAFAAVASLFANATHAQVNLTGETGSVGSIPYLALTHLGEVASTKGVANIQVATAQTLTNTLQNVAEGKTDVGSAPFILAFLMAKGRGPYSALGPENGAKLAAQVRVLYPYVLATTALYAYDSTGLKGWKDLKGRTVLNGPPRGAALSNARAVIQLITGYKEGKDYKGLQVTWGQVVKTITDGSAQAFVLPIIFPDSRMTPALASGSMTIWSVPKKVFESKPFQRYLRAPGNGPLVRPRSVVEFSSGVKLVSEDDNFRGLAAIGGDVVNASMDAKVAKALTAAHISTLKQLKAKAPAAANAGFAILTQAETGMCGANPLKYHPGAVAAWEEAGYKVPACAKP